jgi:hypothetical protein
LVFLYFVITSLSDIQALADSLDNTSHYVMLHTDHNPKCHNANHILRQCKNHKAEAKRQVMTQTNGCWIILTLFRVEAANAAARAAESAREIENQARELRAAAAAAKTQRQSDKVAADTL